jgi:hypothetical protein
MAYEQKPNSGSLFPNKRKEKPNHPDLTGTIEVDGKLYWISAWSKESKISKEEWLSLSVTLKENQGAAKEYSAPAGGKWSRPIAPPLAPSAQAQDALNPSEDKDTDSIPF